MVGEGLTISKASAPRLAAALLATGLVGFPAAPLHAQRSGPFGPSPAGRGLSLIADDGATGEALARPVYEAAAKRWTYRLFPRLLDVRLPRENRAAYVRSAFEAFLAPSCDAYLGVDPVLTGRVLDGVSYGFPSVPCEECVLLRSWLRKRPTSWQVRAALEPPLEP